MYCHGDNIWCGNHLGKYCCWCLQFADFTLAELPYKVVNVIQTGQVTKVANKEDNLSLCLSLSLTHYVMLLRHHRIKFWIPSPNKRSKQCPKRHHFLIKAALRFEATLETESMESCLWVKLQKTHGWMAERERLRGTMYSLWVYCAIVGHLYLRIL